MLYRTINNLLENKPSDEAKLRRPDGFKFPIKKTLSVNLQMASIATTPLVVSKSIELAIKPFQAGEKGLVIFNTADALVNTAGIVTQGADIENKYFNALQSGFVTLGLDMEVK